MYSSRFVSAMEYVRIVHEPDASAAGSSGGALQAARPATSPRAVMRASGRVRTATTLGAGSLAS